MSNRIRELLEEFASKLEAEMKRELMNTIGASDMGLGSSSRSSAKVTNGNGRGRGKGAKRDAGELEALQEKFLGFVSKNPGLRIEQINAQLGTSTKALQLPIRKLLAEGKLKVKGQKRSTTYTAGGGKKAKRAAKG